MEKENTKNIISNKYFWIYIISCVFVVAGGVNSGYTYFFGAIPFMFLIVWISKVKLKNKKIYIFSVVFIIFSIIISITQAKNPILYPILSGGYVEVLKDGYLETNKLWSGFVREESSSCNTCIYQKLNKGDKYRILGVRLNNDGIPNTITILTEIGGFTEGLMFGNITTNKTMRAEWAEYLSRLMNPVILLLILLIPVLLILIFVFAVKYSFSMLKKLIKN
ncbi:hypothetical protein ACFL0K_03335 [Patescibacteria group bacterium]